MNHKAFVVIDIQNDITRHYKDIIDRLNAAVEWAAESGMEIVYILHNNLSAGTRTFKPGGVTIHSMIENEAGMSLPTLYASMAVGLLFCGAEAVLCKFAEAYFKHELADGDPFTLRGAKELLRLGILTVAIPLGTVIVCSIGVAIADNMVPGIDKLSIGEFSSVGLGVMMIVLSLFCRYGAERNEGKPDVCKDQSK